MLKKICIITTTLVLSSCATGLATREYGSPAQSAGALEEIHLSDSSSVSDINGFMPATVLIKTKAQTFCKLYEFCLVDGRIYYKSRDANGDVKQWALLTRTGLPHSTKRGFIAPQRIVEISADDDTLAAFSDEGRLYQCSFTRVNQTYPFKWSDAFGWPDKNPLLQSPLVYENRGWTVAIRREDVLWYEDNYGNQHHYGTKGIESIYFLSKNGQEIRYVDMGLPADFSHGILGPERGSFIARAISASASTVFLINDSGEMYTRLADFDTLGNDPMLFKYTYFREHSPLPGSDFNSLFTPWALPSEDWKKEPPITLTGKARITSSITILQTGQGNFARELRVAGISSAGEPGYYHKMINEDYWAFTAVPLEIDASLFLSGTHSAVTVSSVTSKRGAKQEYAFNGSLWKNEVRVPDISFSVPDFPLVEGSCHLTVTYKDEKCSIVLYPVDLWTYMPRYNPGLDGTPKYFYVTLSIPDTALQSISSEFAGLLAPLFQNRNLALFSCRAEATSNYLLIDFSNAENTSLSLFLTQEGIQDINPNLVRTSAFSEDELVKHYLEGELILKDTTNLTIKRWTEISSVLEKNKEYRARVTNEIKRYHTYRKVAGLSRFSYDVLDFITVVTRLDKIEFLNISTVTQFSGQIMEINDAGYSYMAESREWVYSNILELLDIRIAEYQSIIDHFNSGALTATINPSLRNTFTEYLSLVGFPARINGIITSSNGAPASVRMLDGALLFPGLTFVSGDTHVLIELQDSAKTIVRRKHETLAKKPFKVKISFHPVAGEENLNPDESITEMKGEIEWNGETLKIWRTNNLFSRTLFFEGSIN